MKCPVCQDVDLMLSDRQGVEIDYCPRCRGVWLDRGELDKIIDRTAEIAAPPLPVRRRDDDDYDDDDRYDDDRRDDSRGYPRKKKRRDSFLGELFDF
jgi:Zn-finger nucleic acid-binding protein